MDKPKNFDKARAKAFTGKVISDVAGAVTLHLCAIGDRLGLFKDLAENGPANPDAFAKRPGIDALYAREWLEAMAAGLPIVASNIEGYASVLTHGVEGLLALPGDAEGLADALLQLLADPDRRKQMAQQGRRRAQEFTWQRASQQILSYYERLLHERRSTRSRPQPEPARAGGP